MKPADLLELLREFYREKSALRARHVAAARLVVDYNFNNAYQYVINREDVHLAWLRDAIADLGGTPEEGPSRSSRRRGQHAPESVFGDDRNAGAGLRGPLARSHRARSATRATGRMLRLMLGEMLEQKRFFDQALAGRQDLLGRRADGMGTPGKVLPTRWVAGGRWKFAVAVAVRRLQLAMLSQFRPCGESWWRSGRTWGAGATQSSRQPKPSPALLSGFQLSSHHRNRARRARASRTIPRT